MRLFWTVKKAFNLCKRGRYRLQVEIPTGDDPASGTPIKVNEINRLYIELIGRNIKGEEFRNPLATRRNIDLISLPPLNHSEGGQCSAILAETLKPHKKHFHSF